MSMDKREFVVIDLDGTLCDSRHREQYARDKEWERFHSLLLQDKPWRDVQHLMDCLDFIGTTIVILTGRSEGWGAATNQWLLEHKIVGDTLLMRPEGDWRPDTELKPALLEKWMKESGCTKDDCLFIVEDRDKMVEEWRNRGYQCWQVRSGGY